MEKEPLTDIRELMENPNYDKEQVLLTQKSLLEYKRNRLNGIIELINDVMEGVNTMNFEAFTDEDANKIMGHSLEIMGKKEKEVLIKKFCSLTQRNMQRQKPSVWHILWIKQKLTLRILINPIREYERYFNKTGNRRR
jgi:hypothetical protein